MKSNNLISETTRQEVYSVRDKLTAASMHKTTTEPNSLSSDRDLTHEEQTKVRNFISHLKSTRDVLLTQRVQFMTTKAEKAAILLLAAECNLTISQFLRAYFRTLHPHSVKLLFLTMEKMKAQQLIISSLIDSENFEAIKIKETISQLETLTVVAITLLEERK